MAIRRPVFDPSCGRVTRRAFLADVGMSGADIDLLVATPQRAFADGLADRIGIPAVRTLHAGELVARMHSAQPAAATNGQRLVAPASQTVTGTAQTAAFKAQALVASTADPQQITLGDTVRDKVTLKGVDESFQAVVTARLFGPFRSTGAMRSRVQPSL